MAGFSRYVNLKATMSGAKPPKTRGNFVPPSLWRQLHLTVTSGATVAGDRMHAMGQIFSDDCPRDGCRHTTEHLFWHCSAHDELRAPFSAAIAKYLGLAAAKGAAVSEYINLSLIHI